MRCRRKLCWIVIVVLLICLLGVCIPLGIAQKKLRHLRRITAGLDVDFSDEFDRYTSYYDKEYFSEDETIMRMHQFASNLLSVFGEGVAKTGKSHGEMKDLLENFGFLLDRTE